MGRESLARAQPDDAHFRPAAIEQWPATDRSLTIRRPAMDKEEW